AGNVSIYPESDCRFHHALGPACAPSHRANRFAWVSQYEWFAAQRGSNTRTQFFERAGFAAPTPDQVTRTHVDRTAVFVEIRFKSQSFRQLRIVAPLWVCIQGQVEAKNVQLMAQRGGDTPALRPT